MRDLIALLLRTPLLVGVFAVAALAYPPQGGWVGTPSPATEVGRTIAAERGRPSWGPELAADFPDCRSTLGYDSSAIPSHVVAIQHDGTPARFTLDEAAHIIESVDFPVLWVVGTCPHGETKLRHAALD